MAKGLSILYDLVFYDQDLHKTYYDLTPFMNTNSKKYTKYIQKKNKVIIDQDKIDQFDNFLDENKHYKNITQSIIKNY